MLASQARYVAVMDADLQHDETLLTAMLDAAARGERRSGGREPLCRRRLGGRDWRAHGASRRAGFRPRWRAACSASTLSDPMSGFFMMRRERFEELAPQLSSQGFKILLDIVATARGSLRIAELPFVFGERQHGESKLDTRVALDFAALVLVQAHQRRGLVPLPAVLPGRPYRHRDPHGDAAGRGRVRRSASAPRRRSPPSRRSPGISCSTTCSPTAISASRAGSSSPA